MSQADTIILDLIEYLRFDKQIKNEADFARRIDMLQATITKVKNGTAHFTVEQISCICREFDVNANFIHGIQSKVFNTENSIEIKSYSRAKTLVK